MTEQIFYHLLILSLLHYHSKSQMHSHFLLIMTMNHIHHLIENQSTDNFLEISRLVMNKLKVIWEKWKRSEDLSKNQLSMHSRYKRVMQIIIDKKLTFRLKTMFDCLWRTINLIIQIRSWIARWQIHFS